MKRYWVFTCGEYEPGLGLDDLVDTYQTKKAAMKRAEAGEWGAVFDSKTNKQMAHQYGDWDTPEKVEGLE